MKKTVVTLDINYPKEITDITFPCMEKYAENIGAEFLVLTERKFPDLSITQEKFQLYDLSEDYDWIIFLDADDLINPDSMDFTKIVSEDVVIVSEYLNFLKKPQFVMKNILGKYNLNIHAPFHFLCFNKLMKNVVKPYKNPEELIDYVNLNSEMICNSKDKSWHLDEFILALNIVKYGIDTISLVDDIIKPNNLNILAFDGRYLTTEQKIIKLKENVKKLKNMNKVCGVYE
jgi:hypothetical protein